MIYNRLTIIRTERGVSRQELAKQTGVNYQTIGFIERGAYAPSLELAFAIADFFAVELAVIFSNRPFEPIFKPKQEGK